MKLINIHEVAEVGVSHNAKIRKRPILEYGMVGRITQYARAVFPPGEQADAHRHDDMSEVFTVESGCGEIRINEVAYVFSKGLTVVVEPGEVHEIINTGTVELIVSYFGVLSE
jgi:mannose-6-phosphate isomerase-like protein (cupin superfamily)